MRCDAADKSIDQQGMAWPLRSIGSPVMDFETVVQVESLLHLLEGSCSYFGERSAAVSAIHYERMFLYCITWSLGGRLDDIGRQEFDTALRLLAKEMPAKVKLHSGWYRRSRSQPAT